MITIKCLMQQFGFKRPQPFPSCIFQYVKNSQLQLQKTRFNENVHNNIFYRDIVIMILLYKRMSLEFRKTINP